FFLFLIDLCALFSGLLLELLLGQPQFAFNFEASPQHFTLLASIKEHRLSLSFGHLRQAPSILLVAHQLIVKAIIDDVLIIAQIIHFAFFPLLMAFAATSTLSY